MAPTQWLVLAWRLPTGSSTQRVALWRSLRHLGAVGLTPGAAILPFQEELLEQLDWLAQDIEEHDGDAWVLPVGSLAENEERKVRAQMRADRAEEYAALAHQADAWLRQSGRGPTDDTRGLTALQRRYQKVRQRDFFNAPGRREAAQGIARCLAAGGGRERALRHARAGAR